MFGVASLGVGLLLAFLLRAQPGGDGIDAQVLQREVVPTEEAVAPAELEALSLIREPRRAEEVEAPEVESEPVKSKVGKVAIRALDVNGFDVPFSFALAKINESKGELQVVARPQTVQSPWESAELEPGAWRVCAFRLVERQRGFPFLLEQTSVDLFVQKGETVSFELSFAREALTVGAIGGTILLGELSLQEPKQRRRHRGIFREPKTLVGLWNEHGRLVDTVDVRGGPFDNEFSFLQVPKGEHSVGVMWAWGDVFGWPRGEAQRASAPSLQMALNAKGRESFLKVSFLSKDPVQALPQKIDVMTVVDGVLASGEQTLGAGDYSLHAPPLDEHELQWLVRAKGFKTELLSEEDLLFFSAEPSLPLRLKSGGGTAVVAMPCTLAEVLIYNDPAFLLARCGGLEGISLNRKGAPLGVTGPAGILALPSVSRGAVKLVRPGAPQLLIVDENGEPLTMKMRELYVMPLAPR